MAWVDGPNPNPARPRSQRLQKLSTLLTSKSISVWHRGGMERVNIAVHRYCRDDVRHLRNGNLVPLRRIGGRNRAARAGTPEGSVHR